MARGKTPALKREKEMPSPERKRRRRRSLFNSMANVSVEMMGKKERILLEKRQTTLLAVSGERMTDVRNLAEHFRTCNNAPGTTY